MPTPKPYDMTVKSAKQNHTKTKLVLGTFLGLFALKTLKLAYQRSRLEQVVGSIVGGGDRTVRLDKRFIDSLPKTSFDFRGRPTEPLNFIFLGEAAQIEVAFAAADWQTAVAINGANWVRAFVAGMFDRPYPTAPMTPYYISTTPQDYGFQQETPRHSTRERHHLRIWGTNFKLSDGAKVWLGMASFDASLRLVNGLRFPYHHIDPDLDKEREYVVKQLLKVGAKDTHRFELTSSKSGRNNYRDKYDTDGRIVVMDMRDIKVEAGN